MKSTPFTDLHIQLGAKMHEFAGYNMPIEYKGIINEHLAVCHGVGVFDVSHMGEFFVKGTNALELLQLLTSNDVAALPPGKAQYSCFVNENGGVVDDILVYCCEKNQYLLVVNAANVNKDWDWCMKHNHVGAVLENKSEQIAQLAVQGPLAEAVLQQLTTVDLSAILSYSFAVGTFAEIPDVIISRTGYTGAGGFELYFLNENGVKVWNALFEVGEKYGIVPVGLGARDTLRLEMGYCLYGNDLDDQTTPLEAGLGWITKFTGGKSFIGRTVLEKQRSGGVKRQLCAFEISDKGIPRQGYKITNLDGATIGHVTSGTISPTSRKGIGLGYVSTTYAAVGTPILISIRDRGVSANIVKLPFRRLV
jgi:aminomethyltransferase